MKASVKMKPQSTIKASIPQSTIKASILSEWEWDEEKGESRVN